MNVSRPSEVWRLLVDPAAAGSWNMALDEALLEASAEGGPPTWRFYLWQRPTLSLGYFQAHAARDLHSASAGCDLVRRLSGGGAILHDRELTYSLTLPPGHALAARTERLYEVVHEALITALARLGVAARLCGQEAVELPRREEPFLCFQRRSAGDVLAGRIKIAGSAQRRRKGAVLQHGSVLLDASPDAPELPGLRQVAPAPIAAQALLNTWIELLPDHLEGALEPGCLAPTEQRRAERLEAEKYAAAHWTRRR